jgi:hypothetical protein
VTGFVDSVFAKPEMVTSFENLKPRATALGRAFQLTRARKASTTLFDPKAIKTTLNQTLKHRYFHSQHSGTVRTT